MQKENSKLRPEYLYVALMCAAVALFIVVLIIGSSCERKEPEAESVSSATSTEESSAVSSEESVAKEFLTVTLPRADVMNGLLAISSTGEDAAEADVENLVSVYNASNKYGLSGNSLKLQQPALDAFNRMTNAFYDAKGKNTLLLDKAFTQISALKDRTIEADLPNGYTVSLSVYPVDPDGDYIGSGKFAWLNDNCNSYGYIQRYPAEKSSFTHVSGSGSSRIFRYVGIEHAAYMGKYHLCLEEYLEALRNTSAQQPLQVDYTDAQGNEQQCLVYFAAASEGENTDLQIPKDYIDSYSVSGNGTDGYIVTCYQNG